MSAGLGSLGTLGSLRVNLAMPTKGFEKDVKSADKTLAGFETTTGKRTKAINAGLLGVGAAVITGVALATRHFGNFEKSMKNVQAVSGATAEEFNRLKEFAIEMGSTTAFTAKEAGDAMYFLASAGLNVAEQMATTASVLDLAAATQEELASTASIVVNTLSGFSLEAEESRRVADVFAKAISTSQASMAKLGAGIPVVAATMQDLGVPLEATVTGLSLLFDKGIRAERAATGLRNAMKRLIDPTDEAKDEIARLGLTVEELDPRTNSLVDVIGKLEQAGFDTAASIKLFGLENDAMNLLVATGAEKFRAFESSLRGAAGAAETMKDVQLDSLSGSITLLTSAVDGFVISFGETFAPIVRTAAEVLTGLVTKFNNLGDTTKSILAWTVAIGGVGLGAVGALGLLGTAIPAVVAGFTAMAPLLVAAAPLLVGMVALGAAAWVVKQNMEALNPELIEFNSTVGAAEIIENRTSKAIKLITDELQRLKGLGIDTVDLQVSDLDISMSNLQATINDEGGVWDKLINKITGTKTEVGLLITPTTSVNTLLGALEKHAGKAATTIDELKTGVTDVKQPTEDAAAVTEDYDTKLAKLPTTMDTFTNRFNTLATDTATNSQAIIRDTSEATTQVIEGWGEIPLAAEESTEKELAITKDHIADMRTERDRAAIDEIRDETALSGKKINIQAGEFEARTKIVDDENRLMMTSTDEQIIQADRLAEGKIDAREKDEKAFQTYIDTIVTFQATELDSYEAQKQLLNIEFDDRVAQFAEFGIDTTELERKRREELFVIRSGVWTDFAGRVSGGFNNINTLYNAIRGDQDNFHETWLSRMTDWATRIKGILDGVVTLWQDASSIISGIAGIIGGDDGGGLNLSGLGSIGGGGDSIADFVGPPAPSADFVGPPAPGGDAVGGNGSALGDVAGALSLAAFATGFLDAVNLTPQQLNADGTLPADVRATLVFLQGEEIVRGFEENLAEQIRAAELSVRVGLPTEDVFADPEALEILIRIANTLENPQVATNPVTTAQLLQAVVDLILPELQESGVL